MLSTAPTPQSGVAGSRTMQGDGTPSRLATATGPTSMRFSGSVRVAQNGTSGRMDNRLRIDGERELLESLSPVAVGHIETLDHDDEGAGLLRRT